jgi:hypothetical protein
MRLKNALLPLALCSLVGLAACDEGATPPEPAGISLTLGEIPASPSPTFRTAEVEWFEVCKEYVGTTGPAVTVNVVVDSHETGNDQNFSIMLADGECQDVWLHGGTSLDQVTVTETVPAGYAGSFVKTGLGPANTSTSGAGNTAGGFVDGFNGVLVEFYNEEVPGGGEGCTPGYWKNHLDDWPPSGLSPGDDFETTFGVDLFDPDITLLEAINLGGGGVRKLARHGTAALLNALHPNVDYPFSAAEVIAFVQAGDSSPLAEANELGCEVSN